MQDHIPPVRVQHCLDEREAAAAASDAATFSRIKLGEADKLKATAVEVLDAEEQDRLPEKKAHKSNRNQVMVLSCAPARTPDAL